MFKKSTVFILHFAPSLRFTLSLQSAFHPRSAVCSLRITLTGNRFSITAKESLLRYKYLCKMYQRGKINLI